MSFIASADHPHSSRRSGCWIRILLVSVIMLASGCQGVEYSDGRISQMQGAALGFASSGLASRRDDVIKQGWRRSDRVAPGHTRAKGSRPPIDAPEDGNLSAVPDPKEL